jgi:hypothetical protein
MEMECSMNLNVGKELYLIGFKVIDTGPLILKHACR